MSLSKVGCMSCNLIGHNTYTHIFLVWQCEMFLWCYVAEHSGSHPCYLCSTDSGSDMVIARCDISNDRTESIERSLMTMVELTIHVLTNLLHRNMTRTFDECLYILIPCTKHELAHCVKLGKLRSMFGISRTTRTQTVTK